MKSNVTFTVGLVVMGIYYLLFGITDAVLHFQRPMSDVGSERLFYAGLYLLIGGLFFYSVRLKPHGPRHRHLTLAFALIGASLNVFTMYKWYLDTPHSILNLEWLVGAFLVVWLVVKWSQVYVLPDIASREPRTWQTSAGCLCLVLLAQANMGVAALAATFMANSSNVPMATFLVYTLSVVLFLVITLRFAEIQTLKEFTDKFGVVWPEGRPLFVAASIGIILGGLVVWLVRMGIVHPHSPVADRLEGGVHGGAGYYYGLLLTAPFWEELIIRGYFFRAFRQDYSLLKSIVCILFIIILTHFPVIASAPLGGVILLLVNVAVCLFREKTNSLWHCIACHFAYNATCIFAGDYWPPLYAR